jgi:hypothetical protein
MTTPQQLPTIPKQTQVCLNYWNASTSVDGCEWETVFQEPITIKAGDSISVRNSSLDTSKLSNNNILVEQDITLEFEWITYAMMKKATMDFQNSATSGSFSDAWIYGKDRSVFFEPFIGDGTNPLNAPISINQIIAGSVYRPLVYDVIDSPTPDTPFPSLFFWYMVNDKLIQFPSTEARADGTSYQLISNPTNNIIPTGTPIAPLTPYSSIQSIVSTNFPDAYSIPRSVLLGVITDNVFTYNPTTDVIFYSFGGSKIGDGTIFTEFPFRLFLSNGGADDTNFPYAPVIDWSKSLMKSIGAFSDATNFEDFFYVQVSNQYLFKTTNSFWFSADRYNGRNDFDDNQIYNLLPIINPNDPNPDNFSPYQWALPMTLTPFNPTESFLSTSAPPYQYETTKTVFSTPDVFFDYKMGVFVNPYTSYLWMSLASGAEGNGERFIAANPRLFDTDVNPFAMPVNERLFFTNTLGGWNTGSTYPNALGMNAPIVLVDGKTLTPLKRSTSILLKAGSYTKQNLAIAITRLLVDLQTPSSSVNYTRNQNDYQSNSITLTRQDRCPPELFSSATTSNGYFTEQESLDWTYATFIENAVNPFQCEIVMGVDGIAGGNIHPSASFLASFNYPNLNIATNVSPPPTVPYQKTINLSMVVQGVINNTNYKDKNGDNPLNIPVCFVPLCDDFRIIGNNVLVYNQDPDDSSGTSDTPAFITTGAEQIGTDGFTNSFDTNTPVPYTASDFEFPNEAYQTGVARTSPTAPQIDTILPFISSFDSHQPFSAGVWGTSELSLLYDDAKDQFSFNFLHTPIITNSGGEPTPTIVRSRTGATNPYTNINVVLQNLFSYDQDTYDRRTDVNDRQSGIIFTSLKSHIGGINGVDAGFWEKLGFNLDDIVLPDKYVKPNYRIPFSVFSKYTTGELYSISQNQNVLNSISTRNNEQMPIPDTFTMFQNCLPNTNNPPSQPPPIGFFNDVLYASTTATSLIGINQPSSILNDLAGNILIEIVGYGMGSELQDREAFAVKSIVSLYYLTGNTFLSSTGDGYTYYHLSTIPQTISKLKVRLLSPLTKQKLTNILGNNNSVYLNITQNQQISMEGSVMPTPTKSVRAEKNQESGGD